MASLHKGCPRMPSATLQAIIRDRIELESILHSNGWRGYDGLVDLGYLAEFDFRYSNHKALGIEDIGRAELLLKSVVGKCLTYEITAQ